MILLIGDNRMKVYVLVKRSDDPYLNSFGSIERIFENEDRANEYLDLLMFKDLYDIEEHEVI